MQLLDGAFGLARFRKKKKVILFYFSVAPNVSEAKGKEKKCLHPTDTVQSYTQSYHCGSDGLKSYVTILFLKLL